MQENSQTSDQQTIIVNNNPQGNGIGVAGFVLALIALFLGWVPILGWILWILGLILSGIGVTRKPKGLAIAGLVISLIGLVILILMLGVFGAIAAAGANA